MQPTLGQTGSLPVTAWTMLSGSIFAYYFMGNKDHFIHLLGGVTVWGSKEEVLGSLPIVELRT